MLNYPQVALDFMNRDHAEFVAMCANLIPEPDMDTLLDEPLTRANSMDFVTAGLIQAPGGERT